MTYYRNEDTTILYDNPPSGNGLIEITQQEYAEIKDSIYAIPGGRDVYFFFNRPENSVLMTNAHTDGYSCYDNGDGTGYWDYTLNDALNDLRSEYRSNLREASLSYNEYAAIDGDDMQTNKQQAQQRCISIRDQYESDILTTIQQYSAEE